MKYATQQTVSRKLRGTVTVQELIDLLQNCDPEALVAFQSDYGDYVHTQQLTAIHTAMDLEDREESAVYETAYSNSGLAVREWGYGDEFEEGHEDPTEQLKLVILS